MAERKGGSPGPVRQRIGNRAHLVNDPPQRHVRAQIIGRNGDADAMRQQRRRDPAEPASIQRLPISAVNEDCDGRRRPGLPQVHDLARAIAIGQFDRRPCPAHRPGFGRPSRHHSGMIRNGGAIVVLGLDVDLALTRHVVIR
jgi:hypothetical protein